MRELVDAMVVVVRALLKGVGLFLLFLLCLAVLIGLFFALVKGTKLMWYY